MACRRWAAEPGSQYAYCNAGTNTAGRIIEVVSGISYEEFMLQRLLRPLGMVDTTFRPSPEQLTRLAKAYKPNEANNDLVETAIGQLSPPYDHEPAVACPPRRWLCSPPPTISRSLGA